MTPYGKPAFHYDVTKSDFVSEISPRAEIRPNDLKFYSNPDLSDTKDHLDTSMNFQNEFKATFGRRSQVEFTEYCPETQDQMNFF